MQLFNKWLVFNGYETFNYQYCAGDAPGCGRAHGLCCRRQAGCDHPQTSARGREWHSLVHDMAHGKGGSREIESSDLFYVGDGDM